MTLKTPSSQKQEQKNGRKLANTYLNIQDILRKKMKFHTAL